MVYTEVQYIEDYLNAIKVKTPQHVEEARRSLRFIVHFAKMRGNKVEDELKDIRAHYQAQLSLGSAQSNNIAIMAIIISLIIGFFSIVATSPAEKLLFTPIYLCVLCLMIGAIRGNQRFNKKAVTYTIIMQIIEELLESKDFHKTHK